MRWCPSHVVIEGNKIADELAKLGLEQEPSPDAYTSIGHIRRVMKRKTITNWKAY
jgi:ribonuclease HI